jgi:tol-pal system protein YbgF
MFHALNSHSLVSSGIREKSMTTKPYLAIAGCLLLMAACAPQAELVKINSEMNNLRDERFATTARVQQLQKRLDVLDANVRGTVDVQKVMADYGAKSDQLTTDIQLVQGKLEENNFHITEFAQKLDDKSVLIAELTARVEALEAKVNLLSAGAGSLSAAQSGTANDRDKNAAKGREPSEAYRQAKNDFDKGNFDLALDGFKNYLAQFPDTSLAAAAQYWIGECYSSKKDFPKAIEAFRQVIKSYPRSDKASGAKLKIGLSYLSEKNSAKAKEYLKMVIKEHPGTTEAEIAKDRLRKIHE